jgi:hypothetical protein
MLRRLMAWCVPERALRLQRGFDEQPLDPAHTQGVPDKDVAGRRNLFSALTSHGIAGLDAEAATPQGA